MARKVTIELVDDYDGQSPAEETLAFALDGVSYEIDLSVLNSGTLRGVFEQWIPHARKAGRARRAKNPAKTDRALTRTIREWAREQGLDVSGRGRIPVEISKAYNDAH